MPPPTLEITARPLPGRDAALVNVTGPLTERNRHQLHAAVAKVLTDCPVAVVVDLTGVWLVDQLAGAMFVAMRRKAAEMGPGVELLLAGAEDPFLAARIRALDRAPRLYPDVAAATAAIDDPPDRVRWMFRTLDATMQGASEAGVLVAEACAAWGLPDLTFPAREACFDLFLSARHCPAGPRTVTARTNGERLIVGVRTPPSDLLWPCNRPKAPPGYWHRITGSGHHLGWMRLP